MKLSRRETLALGLIGGLLARPAAALAPREASGPRVSAPRVCHLDDPLALGDLPPRFSWRADEIVQEAYRITVAGSPADLAAGRRLHWDSGRVASADALDIAYEGPPITGTAFWRVEVWPGTGPSLSSATGRWETGPAEWSAAWLACETDTARLDREAGLRWIGGAATPKPDRPRYFRAAFEATTGPAELLVSANEIARLWINGVPVADAHHSNWAEMSVFPFAVRPGRNEIALEVIRRAGFGVAPPVAAAIVRHGSELGERLQLGERHWKSVTVMTDGWHAFGFDDRGWNDAVAASGQLPVGHPWPAYPATQLRKSFTVEDRVVSARLYATALGAYEPWINGARLGDARMTPEFTDPSRRILYQAYDVTQAIAKGENILGFRVGDGTYGGRYSTSGRFSFGPAPCRLLAELEIRYDDGRSERIETGEGWAIAQAPVVANSIYDGESFDARLDDPDWCRSTYSKAGWSPARIIAAPDVAVDPQRAPPIRAHERLRPVSVTRPKPGVAVADFGQNFAGWPVLRIIAPAGTRIEMRFAEQLRPDGEVDQTNLRTARARDTYIAAGRGRETWEPQFTYHGFRYVQIEGDLEQAASWSIEANAGYQSLGETGAFRCGDPIVERFWKNSVWSQKSNFWGLPTDCPQRDERLGWIGDAQVFWEAASFNMDTAAYTGRVMDDMRRSQRANGGFTDCIPAFVPGMDLTSPGWSDGGIVLPHAAWMQYGDTGIIAANWAAMNAHMAAIEASNPGYLWTKSRGADYGDWLAVDASDANPGLATTPKDLVATAYWANNAAMMEKMAEALGKSGDAARYRKLFSDIRIAFNKAFVAPDGKIGNESQTGYVLPIRFGLLDGSLARDAGRRLAADIERRGGHLSTGFLGTPHILDALAMTGQDAAAIGLLVQRSFPSWGYMVERGATSMWERWNSDTADGGMNSLNHYAFGAIGAFLFRRIAGIAPLAPGFRAVRIAPMIDRRLKTAGATYRSASGTIRTDWKADGGSYRLDVEIPAGVRAEVALPNRRETTAKPGLNRFRGKL